MKNLISVLTGFIILSLGTVTFAQIGSQPPVEPPGKPVTPLSQKLHRGMAFEILLSNFGVGVGGEYRQVITPLTELTANLRIAGLKDVSEQTFTTIYGQETPHKYRRVFVFPLTVGIRHRIFARMLDDNFRVHIAAAAGPSMAFVYPYFKDINGNGIRDYGNLSDQNGNPIAQYEPMNDIFSGWKDGYLKWGTSGQVVLSVDLGKMKKIGTISVGYYFHYYPGAIQMLEPNAYVLQSSGNNGQQTTYYQFQENVNSPQKYFGSPIISFSFGGMW